VVVAASLAALAADGRGSVDASLGAAHPTQIRALLNALFSDVAAADAASRAVGTKRKKIPEARLNAWAGRRLADALRIPLASADSVIVAHLEGRGLSAALKAIREERRRARQK